jgi:hypothetical protein
LTRSRQSPAPGRSPASYTNKLKAQQMQALGLPGPPSLYEEDHLISLEIGGNPTDPNNLWPQPYAGKWGARTKDRIETMLKVLVCRGTIPLAEAQREISTDWVAAWLARIGNANQAGKGNSK